VLPLVGAVVVTLVVILSLQASESDAEKRRVEHVLIGALVVAGAVYLLTRAGFGWAAVGLVLLYSAARRLGNRARPAPSAAGPGDPTRPPMSREEAYQVLGLEPGASPERIRDEYKRLMKKMHPDQGGTNYLAARINEAKDVLLGRT
jgi:DnaJ-domain-containing protein 1